MKNLIILFCFFSCSTYAQIQSVDYLMTYNTEMNQYDVSLVVIDGETSIPTHRNQYNSQISIVVPTGRSLTVTESYMPLENNSNYTGTVPTTWFVTTQLNASVADPTIDIFNVIQTLSPSSFYNDLAAGDNVLLFSFKVGTSGEFMEGVRFFKNETDPSSLDAGMGGSDCSNYFKIGDCRNLFNSSYEEFNPSSLAEASPASIITYPNPFQNEISIEVSEIVKYIQVLNASGKVYYNSFENSTTSIRIPSTHFPKGVYFVMVELNSGEQITQKILKL